MKQYPIAVFCDHPTVHFEYRVVARMARVSEDFIRQCEREDLVVSRTMLHGRKGLSCEDIRKLKLIRHLNKDMGLDLDAVDFVLRYRNRIDRIARQLEEMEQRLQQKEQEHRIKILALRRQLERLEDGG